MCCDAFVGCSAGCDVCHNCFMPKNGHGTWDGPELPDANDVAAALYEITAAGRNMKPSIDELAAALRTVRDVYAAIRVASGG